MSESKAVDENLQGFWNRFHSIFNKGKDEVVRSSKVSKARLDVSSLKKERERVFERLGEEIYKRHKNKPSSISGLDSFFAEIDIINIKLSSKERELKDLKGEAVLNIQPAPLDTGISQERKERIYRPRRKPSEVRQDTNIESSMGL